MINTQQQRLERVFGSVMGISNLPESASVTTVSDWDSEAHITLILALEREFGMTITAREAGEMLSVREIKSVLSRKGIRD